VIKPPSSHYQQVLATCVLSKRLLAKMSCSAYTISRSLCLFSPHSVKCADCVQHRICYNSNFLTDNFDHLTIEQRKLEVACNTILKRLLQEID
jgi:hypothetical protein